MRKTLPNITHVAISFTGVVWSLPKPYRHGHIHALVGLLNPPGLNTKVEVQGFLDNRGRFLMRHEAEVVARACGQLTGELIGSILTSEDLW